MDDIRHFQNWPFSASLFMTPPIYYGRRAEVWHGVPEAREGGPWCARDLGKKAKADLNQMLAEKSVRS